MFSAEYRVFGMSCGHCAKSVREELSGVAGLAGVDVDASTGLLSVHSVATVDDDAVLSAVDAAGYRAERISHS